MAMSLISVRLMAWGLGCISAAGLILATLAMIFARRSEATGGGRGEERRGREGGGEREGKRGKGEDEEVRKT